MCHGVFDVVHPGHVRHLIYAKKTADILVVSITTDRHIEKGTYRPHVPEKIRAGNLAAFEMVDYVIIDENPNPLENIRFLQPDYFAKGYEYVEGQVNPKSADEELLLKSYGGEMIFTPGDYVLSSTNLVELSPPELKMEKLITVMETDQITFANLRETIAMMAGKRVHVVGDTIVDTMTRCSMIGGQTKTPTMSVLFQGRHDFVGGAGIVAKHMRAAGADVIFSTVLGDDALKDFVLADLEQAGVNCRVGIDHNRPTTQKNAIVVENYRLLKVDTLDNRPVSGAVLQTLADNIGEVSADAVVFSDFRHGIFNRGTIPTLTEAIPDGMYRVADSQVASRWGNITEFRGFDLVTPNEREARFALADQDSGVFPLAVDVQAACGCKTLILKLGDKGVLTYLGGDRTELESLFVLDSFVSNVVDPVGAGDALLAYATLSMLAGGSAAEATIIGSMAAAIECESDGNIPVRPETVLERLDGVERQINFR
jgi:rfaE bifunctional protein kinase chain/domain